MDYWEKYEGLIAFVETMVIAIVIWAIIFRPDWNLVINFIL